MKNNGVLSTKIASILPLGGNSLVLIAVTGLIGGLVAGLAALVAVSSVPPANDVHSFTARLKVMCKVISEIILLHTLI